LAKEELTVMTAEGQSSLIAATVTPLPVEFSDGNDAPRASQTRVANVQHAAGLSDAALGSLLDDAAAITKRGREGTIMCIPYLLATLRALITVPDEGLALGEGTSPVPAPVWPAPLGPRASDASPPHTPDDPPGEGAAGALWSTVRGRCCTWSGGLFSQEAVPLSTPPFAPSFERRVLRAISPSLHPALSR